MPALETILTAARIPQSASAHIPWLVLTDFGARYTGATVAAGHTVLAAYNQAHGTGLQLLPFVSRARSFDVFSAIRLLATNLEHLLAYADGVDQTQTLPVAVTFVVDPEKDRKNVLSSWERNGRRVYIAHPDHGQASTLLQDPAWQLLSAVEIDKQRIIPDAEIIAEQRQLWDGHAAYAPAAALAPLLSPAGIGEPLSSIRYYDTLARNSQTITQLSNHHFTPTPHTPLHFPQTTSSRNIVLHYVGNEHASPGDFLNQISFPPNTLLHFADYGTAKNWKEAASVLYFAGINIFQDAPVEHIILYHDPDAAESVIAKLDTGHEAGITVAAPNNEAGTLLFDLYAPATWKLQPASPSLQQLLQPTCDNLGIIKRNGTFRPRTVDEALHLYDVAVLESDANGNIRLNINPTSLGDYGSVAAVTLFHENGNVGTFGVRSNYSEPEESGFTVAGRSAGAILNPAASGAVPSRRPLLELFTPSSSLAELLRQTRGISLAAGDRVQVQFHYPA